MRDPTQSEAAMEMARATKSLAAAETLLGQNLLADAQALLREAGRYLGQT